MLFEYMDFVTRHTHRLERSTLQALYNNFELSFQELLMKSNRLTVHIN